MQRKDSDHEHVGYGVYMLTWITLLVLTSITVTVAGMKLGALSVLTAILIASIKAGVVLSLFMHLKYEKPLFKMTVWVAIAALAIFIGITYTDVLFR